MVCRRLERRAGHRPPHPRPVGTARPTTLAGDVAFLASAPAVRPSIRARVGARTGFGHEVESRPYVTNRGDRGSGRPAAPGRHLLRHRHGDDHRGRDVSTGAYAASGHGPPARSDQPPGPRPATADLALRRIPRALNRSVAAPADAKPARAPCACTRPPEGGQRLGSVPRCPVLASIRAISTRARAMTAANPTTHTPRSTITNAVVPAMPALHPRHSKCQVHYNEHAHPGPPRNRPVRATTSTYDCMSLDRDLCEHEAASPYALHTSRPSPAPALALTPPGPSRPSPSARPTRLSRSTISPSCPPRTEGPRGDGDLSHRAR